MYNDSHTNRGNSSRKHLPKKRLSLLLLVLVVLAGVLVGSTVAFLAANTETIVNSFRSVSVSTEIEEEFTGYVKSSVTVKNTGDVNAFLRAAVVVTWQNADGSVYPDAPLPVTDYTVSYPTDTGWVKHTDGLYYLPRPSAPAAQPGFC